MAILALVGGAIGFLSFTSSKQEEFQAACLAVQSRLDFAEELMLFGTDLEVTFKLKGKQLQVVIEPDRPLDQTTMSLLSIPSPITGIDEITFQNLSTDQIKLKYLSKGFLRPQGELTLRGTYGHKVLKLGLEATPFFSEELYPYEVLQKKS